MVCPILFTTDQSVTGCNGPPCATHDRSACGKAASVYVGSCGVALYEFTLYNWALFD